MMSSIKNLKLVKDTQTLLPEPSQAFWSQEQERQLRIKDTRAATF